MAVRERMFYEIACDVCEEVFESSEGVDVWDELDYLEILLREDEWLTVGKKHYCPDCITSIPDDAE